MPPLNKENWKKLAENTARDFCRETPRIKQESGVVFYERLLKAFHTVLIAQESQVRKEILDDFYRVGKGTLHFDCTDGMDFSAIKEVEVGHFKVKRRMRGLAQTPWDAIKKLKESLRSSHDIARDIEQDNKK